MSTMSHNKQQRKDWHAGKQKKGETKQAWFRRVVIRAKNLRGAKQIPGLTYKPLDS